MTAAAANILAAPLLCSATGSGDTFATSLLSARDSCSGPHWSKWFPKAWKYGENTAALLILLGYLIIHFFEHTVTPHFHFGEETHHDEFVHSHTGYSVLLGLIIHAFFDGIAIASGFLVSNWLGWIIFLAIFLHKIPEGFTVSSVMLASGRSRGIAWGASIILGGATLAGC